MTLFYFSDVLGIVLFVNDVRIVHGAFGQQNNVCEILITDHRYSINQKWFFISWINTNNIHCVFMFIKKNSSHQPLTVSAWNDIADFFKEKPLSYPIIGFTSLKVTPQKG